MVRTITSGAQLKATGRGRLQEAVRENKFVELQVENGDTTSKEVTRLMVWNYFRRYLPKGPFRMLTIPGKFWPFENRVLKARPGSFFVGAEIRHKTFEDSALYMPGGIGQERQECLRKGERSFKTYHTSSAVLFRASLQDILCLGRSDKDSRDKKHWGKLLKSNDCAWLDFSSNWCEATEQALRMLGMHMRMQTTVAPIAITMSMRPNPHKPITGEGSYFDRLRNSIYTALNRSDWRSFEFPKDGGTLEYRGQGDARMMIVCGTLISDKKGRRK